MILIWRCLQDLFYLLTYLLYSIVMVHLHQAQLCKVTWFKSIMPKFAKRHGRTQDFRSKGAMVTSHKES